MLLEAGHRFEDVLGYTLAQARAFGDAAERRRKKRRTEALVVLRGARYDKKAYAKLLKASELAEWLIPS